MVERLDGSWFAVLRYPGREAVQRPCASYEAGRAGCEAWAGRHRAALQTHAERRHLTWLARQTWRGLDSLIARRRLEELDRQAPAAPHPCRGPHGWMAGWPARRTALGGPDPGSAHHALLVT